MPFAPHLRLTVSGTFEGGNGSAYEIWSWRLNLSDPPSQAGNPGNYSQARVDDYAADVRAFHTSGGAQICQETVLREVKLARILPTGLYAEEPLRSVLFARGGNGAMTHPLQVAHAVSLGTDRRGPSGQGRFYIPGSVAPVNPDDALVSLAIATGVQLASFTLLNALNNVPGIDVPNTPAVTIASSKGFNSDVTTVRVGRALDTIRSRRNQLAEKYLAPTPL